MSETGQVRPPHVAPRAWVRMDGSGLIPFASRQAELLFGYDGEDLGGQPIEMLIPEPVCKVYQEYWQDSCPGSQDRGLDLMRSGRSRDGHWFPARVNVSHVDTRHGLVVIAEVRDLTDGDEVGR